MSDERYLPPWTPAYWMRKYFTRKIKDTEKEIKHLKSQGKWAEAEKLKYKLINSWWGYKKFKK